MMCGRDPINEPAESPKVGMLNAVRLITALLMLPLMVVGIVGQLSAFPMLFADDLNASALRMGWSTLFALACGCIAMKLAQDAVKDLKAKLAE